MDYNKLVRDRIPEIIAAQGQKPIIRVMDDKEYISSLEKKFDEEVAEYHESKELEELADVLEVIYALCEILLSSKLNDAPFGRLFRADFRTLQMCQSL